MTLGQFADSALCLAADRFGRILPDSLSIVRKPARSVTDGLWGFLRWCGSLRLRALSRGEFTVRSAGRFRLGVLDLGLGVRLFISLWLWFGLGLGLFRFGLGVSL